MNPLTHRDGVRIEEFLGGLANQEVSLEGLLPDEGWTAYLTVDEDAWNRDCGPVARWWGPDEDEQTDEGLIVTLDGTGDCLEVIDMLTRLDFTGLNQSSIALEVSDEVAEQLGDASLVHPRNGHLKRRWVYVFRASTASGAQYPFTIETTGGVFRTPAEPAVVNAHLGDFTPGAYLATFNSAREVIRLTPLEEVRGNEFNA